MDKPTRNLIKKATQDARGLLETEFTGHVTVGHETGGGETDALQVLLNHHDRLGQFGPIILGAVGGRIEAGK